MPAGARLRHQAFVYDSKDEFVAAMAPFVADGLERGDRVFAATTPANIQALREELGDDAARVDFEESAAWYREPYTTLDAYRRYLDQHANGSIVRVIGEPAWNGSEAQVRQWARYESVINLALADSPAWIVCPYGSATLPDPILAYAEHTHPERVEDGSVTACPGYLSPEDFLPGRPATAPPTAHELPLEGAPFRVLVGEHAREAELSPERVDDFVLAAHEVAANAVKHGAPPFRALVWVHDGELVCQIADSGPGIADPLAGWMPPNGAPNGGWGLPIARQLCDAVEIAPSDAGTIVSLHVNLDD